MSKMPVAADISDAGPMDEQDLIAVLRAEESDATSFYTSELATEQSVAMDRYFGAKYGNEVEGRSQITTHEVEDTVNWMLPTVMATYMGNDDFVSCEANAPDDQSNIDDAAQYLQHILMEDNEGAKIIHDFFFDGAVQRLGVVSVLWEDPQPKPPEILEGVSIEQIMQIDADPEYEILEAEESDQTLGAQPAPQPGQAPGQPPAQQDPNQPTPLVPIEIPTFTLKVKHTPSMGKVRIENVPPEEIAWSRRARSFPSRKRGHVISAGYVRRKQERFLADVLQMWPDYQPDVVSGAAHATQHSYDMDNDPRVLSRFQDESVSLGTKANNVQNRKKVDLLTEYIWIDYDNDGIVELRRVIRVENTILENIAVDDCEYKSWSPIRVAHRAIGRSVADTVMDLQKIRTTMMRLMLDGLSQSLVPRNAVNTQMVDEQGIDDLLDAEIGGVIRCKGDVRAAIQPLVNPDVSGNALTALEYVDQKVEQQSGVSRHAQGIAPDAITKTASGIENLQAAANERITMVRAWLGLGLQEILERVLQLVVAHQDRPRWIEIKGKPLTVDPRTWSDQMRVKVHIGSGANKQTQIANLAGIAQKQEQAIQVGGPNNPVCSVENLLYTYARGVEAMGFKDASKFFRTPDAANQILQQAAQQPPPPDPKMAQVQANAQAKQAELQMKGQQAQQKAEQDQAALQFKMMLERQQQQAEAALALTQQRAEAALAAQQQQFEQRLAIQEQLFNERLAEREADRKHELAETQADNAHQVAVKKASMRPNGKPGAGTGTDVRFGGKLG